MSIPYFRLALGYYQRRSPDHRLSAASCVVTSRAESLWGCACESRSVSRGGETNISSSNSPRDQLSVSSTRGCSYSLSTT